MAPRSFILSFTFLCLLSFSGYAQIELDNASFEGAPQDATLPQGWFACQMGTTPDILPGVWGVIMEPSDGDSYIGLITLRYGFFLSVARYYENKRYKY